MCPEYSKIDDNDDDKDDDGDAFPSPDTQHNSLYIVSSQHVFLELS